MKKFIAAVKHVKKMYPVLWDHSRIANRRIMVRYWLPGTQLTLWSKP